LASPDDNEQAFSKAVALHQRGDLAQAENLYRQILARVPDHLDCLNLLGVVAVQTGRGQLAVELIGKAILLNDKVADFHNNIGEAFRQLRDLDRAAAHFTRAADLEPTFLEAQQNLGDVLQTQGKLDQAAAVYARILSAKPDLAATHGRLGQVLRRQGKLAEALTHFRRAATIAGSAEAYHRLGLVLCEQGTLDDAIEEFRRALSLKKEFPQAHNDLGNALRERGDLDLAATELNRAIELKPDYDHALHNLALAELACGRHAQAVTLARRALDLQENKENKALFARCLKERPSLAAASDLRPLLMRALSEPWVRPNDLAPAVVRHLKADATTAYFITRGAAAGPDARERAALLDDPGFNAFAGNELLQCLLTNTLVADLALERVLTGLRAALLTSASEAPRRAELEAAIAFFVALARQCFITDYVYAETEGEREQVEALRDFLDGALRTGTPIPPSSVAALACYVPLHSLASANLLLERHWPPALDELLTQQVREPMAVRQYRASLQRLTAIEDPVSRTVREQYEENPYPTWTKLAPADAWPSIGAYVRNLFPLAQFERTANPDSDILVAGCGTGQQSIETAQRFPHVRVLAVDLSSASLAYARMKTEAARVSNIAYAQADLLQLVHDPEKWVPVFGKDHAPKIGLERDGDSKKSHPVLATIDQTFDMIETTGVLHHLDDPMRGWRVLLSRLRPNGLMRVGLYSRLARTDVRAARARIAQRGYRATADDIRRCRQEIMALGSSAEFAWLATSPDFASTSACRDLLFHAHERQLGLVEIQSFLANENLAFLGFELEARVLERYRARFPNDLAMTNLENWHLFEEENPSTFGAMYQFWIQKRR
jgi:Flp pilus assembly protein TadD/SAM-dependent methyltransferase